MTKKNINKQIDGLIKYLSSPDEKSNADLIRNYFRSIYPEFKCETQADNADGYVAGHFILELKSKQQDWFKGLIQGLAVTARVYKHLGSQSSHFLAQINCDYNLISAHFNCVYKNSGPH